MHSGGLDIICVTKYLPWRAPLLVPECLHGCLGLSKGEPMTGSGFQHLATVRKIKSEMKLDSHRKNIASSVFRASFTTCAFTFSTHHPHSTPHLAGSTTANGCSSILYGRTDLNTRLHPISSVARSQTSRSEKSRP